MQHGRSRADLHLPMTLSYNDNAKTMLANVGVGGCSNPAIHQSECAALSDKLSSTDRARNWSTAGFVVGGAALVGTAIYWFWPHNSSEGSTLRVNGDIGNGLSSIALEGSF